MSPSPRTLKNLKRTVALSAAVLATFGQNARLFANTEQDVKNGSTDLTAAATYTPTGTPTATSDVTFTNVVYNPATFTVGTSLNFGTLNDLSPTALTINNGTAAADSLALSGGGDTVPGSASADLLYVATGSSLTIASGTNPLGLTLATAGNLDVAGTATINSVVSGASGFTKTGAGTLTLGGANTTLTGGLTVQTGTVVGTTSASAFGAGSINLGVASGTTSATLLGSAFTYTNAINLATGNTGALTVGSNGATAAVFSGAITGTNNLVLQSNSTGTVTLSNAAISFTGSITNNGTGTGTNVISSAIGSNVTNLIQNSTTSQLTYNASATAGANAMQAVTVSAGQLNVVNAGTVTNPLGTGTITLGATSGSAATTIQLYGSGSTNFTLPNAINVPSGGTGSITLFDTQGTQTINGAITLNSNNGSSNFPTLTFKNNNSSAGSNQNINGGVTGSGNLVLNQTGGGAGIFFATGSVNNTGTITNTDTAGTATISAVIGANVTSVIQNGAGALTLSNTNLFAGTTTVSSGTLNANAAGALGTSNVTVSGGTLAQSVVNALNGATQTLTVSSGTANLTFGNTFGGGTTVSGGTLNVGNGTTGTATGNGSVSLNGGTLITPTAGGTIGGALNGGSNPATIAPGGFYANGAPGGTVATLNVGSLALTSATTLNFDLTTPAGADDLIKVANTGTLTATGTVPITLGELPAQAGTYHLINFFSSSTPSLSFSGPTSVGAGRLSVTYQVDQVGTTNQYYVDAVATGSGASSFTFTNASNPAGDSFSTPTNYTPNGVPGVAGDSVTFNNGYSGGAGTTYTVNLNGANPRLGSVTFANTGNSGFVLAAGTGGTLTFDNAGAAATISNSTLNNAITAPVALVSNTNVTVATGTTLTMSGVISGAGSLNLTASSAGTLLLGGPSPNTYTGGTAISGGTVKLGNGNGLGATANAITIASGATLDLNGQSLAQTLPTGLTGTGVGGNGLIVNSNTAATATVPAFSNGTSAFTTGGAGNITFNGITGSGGGIAITKVGAGTVTLAGGADNSYTAATVNGGTLVLAKASTGAFHALGGGLTINNGTTAQLAGSGGDQVYDPNTVTINGAGSTFDLNGTSETIGALAAAASGGVVTNTSATASTLTVGGGGVGNTSGTYAGVIQDGVSKVALSLSTKTGGTATQILTGANTYTGATTIGTLTTLQIGNGGATGSLSAATTVANTGTLTFNLSGPLAFPNSISGAGTVNQIGAGTTTFSGNNTYTGATAVTNGTLALNGSSGTVLGATAVTVGNNTSNSATLLVRGNNTVGTAAGGGITINGGGASAVGQGTLSMVDGTINTLNFTNLTTAANSLVLGNATASQPAILNFEVGSSAGSSDSIALPANNKLLVNTGGAVLNITLPAVVASGTTTYNLITYSAGNATLGTTGFVFSNGTNTETLNGNTLTLNNSGTAEQLQIVNSSTATVPATAYFRSDSTDNTWTNAANFTSDAAGTTPAGGPPGATTDVFIAANTAATPNNKYQATNLGGNFTINTLTIGTGAAQGNPVTVGTAGTTNGLTVLGTADATYTTAGSGVNVLAGVGAVTLNAQLVLGGTQAETFTNNSSNPVTLSGGISGNNALTYAGTGTTTLASTDSRVATTLIRGGALQISSTGSITSTTLVDASASAAGSTGNGAVLAVNGGMVNNSTAVRIGFAQSGLTTAVGAVYLNGGTFTTASDTTIGFNSVTGGSSTGFLYQTAGTYNQAGGTYYLAPINGGGVSGSATGTANISGGTVTTAGMNFGGAAGGGGITSFNLNGGNFTSTGAIASNTSAAASAATFNFNGGTFVAQGLTTGATNTTINFNGGTVRASASPATNFFLGATNSVNVYAGGATFDTQTFTVPFTQKLVNPAGSAVTSASVTDSTDTFTAPTVVTFTYPNGTTGSPATGYTILNSAGKVTGVTITNGGSSSAAPTGVTIAGATPANVSTPTFTTALNSTGGLTKLGVGDLNLSGASTYTGNTIISNGRIGIAANGVIPSSSLVVQSGTGQLIVNATSVTVSNNFNLSTTGYRELGGNLNADGGIRLFAGGGDTLSGGTITLSGNSRIGTYTTGTHTVTDMITGGFGMDYFGLNGANNNAEAYLVNGTTSNYTGDTSITNQDYNAVYTGASTTLKVGSTTAIPSGATAGNLDFYGTDANHLTVLDLNGFATTINGTTVEIAAAGARITNSGASATLTVGAANTTSAFSGTITDSGTGKFLSLTKTGSGTFTLGGTGSYGGATTITAGTLLVTGAITGTGAVNVNGGMLGGSGSIAGPATIAANATLSPSAGGSPRVLTLGSGTGANVLTFAATTSNYQVTLIGPGDSGTGLAREGVTYDSTVNANTSGTALALNGANLVLVDNVTASGTYDILQNAHDDGAALVHQFSYGGTPLANGAQFSGGNNLFTILYNSNSTGTGSGNDIVLVSSTPEPAAAAVLGLGALGLLARRRRAAR